MLSNLPPGYGFWLEPVLVLAVGTVMVVGLAALAGRLAETAVWQRTIWQAATLGLLVLLVVELSGTASALVRLARKTTEPVPAETADRRSPESAVVQGDRTVVQALRRGQETLAEGATFAEGAEQKGVTGGSPVRAERAPVDKLSVPAVLLSMQDSIGRAWDVPADAPAGPVAAQEHPAGTNLRSVPADGEVEDLPLPARAEVVVPRSLSPVAVVRPLESGPARWPGALWMLGAAVIAVRLLWARLLLFLFRRRRDAASDEALCRRVGRLARRLGIRRPVAVLEAAGLTAPVAFGSFRPTLVLPKKFSCQFELREQEAMIVHELAHLAACDPAWLSVADLTCAVLWWHPLSWWSRRRLRMANEAAADEASLLIPEGPDVLASCLVVLGRRLAGGRRRRLGWLSVEGPGFRSGLGRRVERLLNISSRSWRAPRRALLALAKSTLPVALVIAAVFCTAWAHPQAASLQGETTMNVLASSWRRSLAAAAVAVFLAPISGDAVSQEPGEREVLVRRLEVLRTALPALREAERGDAVELVERAIHAGEVTLAGRNDDEAHQIRERAPGPGQLAEILTIAAELWGKFDKPDKAELVGRLADEFRAEAKPEREVERPAKERERHEAEEHGRAEREEQIHRLKRESDQLAEKSLRIKEKLQGLGDHQNEEARELKEALDGTRHQMQNIERELAELTRDRPRPEGAKREREEVFRHLNELKEAYERARKEGRAEEAERIRREAEGIKADFERRGQRPAPDAPPPPEREEMERRMHHLRAAIENLHAAGLHEQAERLAREAEHLIHGGPRPDPNLPSQAPRPLPPGREGPPHPDQPDPMIHELGNQVRQLQERMEQMGGKVERALNEIRHEMEGMGRKIEERSQKIEGRTNEIEERGNQLKREIEEMGGRLKALWDDEQKEDDDDDDDEEEREEKGEE